MAPLQREGRRQSSTRTRETRYRNKRDRPPPKQTHIPLRGSALEFFSLPFLTRASRGAYAVALSVLTVIMWILDNRAQERTNTFVTQIGKRHLRLVFVLRISRFLVATRRRRCLGLARATGISCRKFRRTELIRFQSVFFRSVEETVRCHDTFKNLEI